MSDNYLAHFTKEINGIAGEECECREIGGAFYMFGSELATLRCLKVYRNCKNARAGWSENLNTFYFSLETSF